MSFRIRGLPAERFQHLFDLSDAELAERGAPGLLEPLGELAADGGRAVGTEGLGHGTQGVGQRHIRVVVVRVVQIDVVGLQTPQ